LTSIDILVAQRGTKGTVDTAIKVLLRTAIQIGTRGSVVSEVGLPKPAVNPPSPN